MKVRWQTHLYHLLFKNKFWWTCFNVFFKNKLIERILILCHFYIRSINNYKNPTGINPIGIGSPIVTSDSPRARNVFSKLRLGGWVGHFVAFVNDNIPNILLTISLLFIIKKTFNCLF